MIAREVQLMLVAIQFLTRIPVPSFKNFEPSWLDRAARYFPLVGALVGVIAGFALLAASAILPQPVPVVVALAAGIAVTGAFHEDGLADTADGLGGGLTRDRRLEIMKDSRIGTYGAVALMIALALKASALIAVDPYSAAMMLIAAHAGGRFATVLAIWALPYAGDAEAAKVKPLATGLRLGELAAAAALGLIPGLLVLSPVIVLSSSVIALLAAAALAAVSKRLIGGYTGDVLGALEQVFETAFMMTASAIISGPG